MRRIVQSRNVRWCFKEIGEVYRVDNGKAPWHAELSLKKVPKRGWPVGCFKSEKRAKAALVKAYANAAPEQKARWLAEADAFWGDFFKDPMFGGTR